MTTDTELDELVGQAIVSSLQADARSDASLELLRLLVQEQAPSVYQVDSRTAPIVELLPSARAQHARPPRRRALITAVASLVAVAAATALVLIGNDIERVDTTSADTGQRHVGADPLLVVGPNQPLVIISSDPERLAVAEVLACQAFGWIPGELALVEAELLPATDSSAEIVVRSGTMGDQFCHPDDSMGSIDRPAPRALAPGELMYTSGFSTWRSDGAETGEVQIEGRLAAGVEHIEIVSPPMLSQAFSGGGQWFVVRASASTSALADLDAGNMTFSVRLVDGTTTRVSWEDLQAATRDSVCFNDACVDRAIALVRDEAAQIGVGAQRDALSDLRITQAEYDDALADFDDCLFGSGIVDSLNGTPHIEVGTPDADAATSCWTNHIRFVDQARLWQLDLVFRLDTEIFVAPTFAVFVRSDTTDSEMAEVRMLFTEFRATARFVDQTATGVELRDFFDSEAELLEAIGSGTAPPSFRVSLGGIENAEELASRLEELPQVSTVILPNPER